MTTTERHRAPGGPGRVRRALGRQWVVFVVLGALFVAFIVLQLQRGSEVVEAEGDKVEAQQTLGVVADPLARLCAEDATVRARAGAEACSAAAQVVAVPGPEGPAGATGATGAEGVPGRGIVSTTLAADGHLLVTYSDGTQNDVGSVVGAPGADGAEGPAGEAGQGITSSTIAAGRLVLTFSDGTTRDLGPIVGERGADGAAGPAGAEGAKGTDGRGITSTEIVADRLVITYDDGTTEDAGPVPAGPAGPQGDPAELPSTFTFDGVGDGTWTCTRDPGGDAAPVYTCSGGADGSRPADADSTEPPD